jgi:hypothetical protein
LSDSPHAYYPHEIHSQVEKPARLILAIQEAEIKKILVQSHPHPPANICEVYLEKLHHKKGLVEWLKW